MDSQIQSLFKQENNFYDALEKANAQDPAQFDLISRLITTDPSLRVHSVPFLKYLTRNTDNLLEKLSCIDTYFMAYLADEQQSIIFMYCFKVWDSGEDLFDAQVHALVYSILERCKISAVQWEKELLDSKSGKKAKSLEMYDNMIEDYIFNPSDNYPKDVQLNKDVNITALARFTLFNVLYEGDMRPIRFVNDELFELSDECIQFIQQLDKSTFTIETQIVENALRNPEKRLPCYAMNHNITTTHVNNLDTVMRECCNLLIHAPMFVHVITLCLINLLHIAKQRCTKELYQQYLMMCQAAWLRMLQSLLNHLVFLNPKSALFNTSTLTKCCACLVQFQRYTQYDNDFQHHIHTIWNDYMRKRVIYLNSTGLTDDTLSWLQNLIMTSTIVSLSPAKTI